MTECQKKTNLKMAAKQKKISNFLVYIFCAVGIAGCSNIPASLNKSVCDYDYNIYNHHVKTHREIDKMGV